jgi:hypothetical protein
MWNKFNLIGLHTFWQSIWQNVSYRRLATALLLSVFLHFLIINQFFIDSINPQDQHSIIEARLVLPPALTRLAFPKPALLKKIPKKIITKPNPPALAASEPTIPTTETTALSDAMPTNQADAPNISDDYTQGLATIAQKTDAQETKNKETKTKVTETQVTETQESVAQLPEESGIAINSQAYHYIETEFDVRTDLDAKVNASAAGKAKIIFQLLPNNKQYKLKSLIQAKGLASLLIPDLLQISEGNLTQSGLQPEHYLYQFGNKANKTFNAYFDWRNQQLSLHSANGDQLLNLPSGTQDLLSFMYQFMFVAPMQSMHLSITNGKKIGSYDYSFEGEEIIATKIGDINTIHLMRMAAEGEKKTELWLALDYQYVPVKIRETEKQGKVYELLMTSLKTETRVAATEQESATQ